MSVYTSPIYSNNGSYTGTSLPPELLKLLNTDLTNGDFIGFGNGSITQDGQVYSPVYDNGMTNVGENATYQTPTLTGWDSMAVGAKPGDFYTTYDTSGQGGYTHPIMDGGKFKLSDFKDLGQAILTIGTMYLAGQGLAAAGAGSEGGIGGSGIGAGTGAGADATGSVTGAVADTVQGNSINALDGATGVGYGSDPELTSLASSDSAFNKALADSGLTTSQVSSAGLTSADIQAALKGGYLTQLLSGITSLVTGNKGKDTANTVLNQGDPFGKYRPYFGNELMKLETDPMEITKTPGYQTGIDAITRTQAANGYLGSGNMMTSLMNYGQSFFANRENQVAGLAGANINPNAALQTWANLLGQSNATSNNGIMQLIQGAIGMYNNGGLNLSGLTSGSGT